jgi:hypothetical protein
MLKNKKIILLALSAAFILALGIGALIGGVVTVASAQEASFRGSPLGEIASNGMDGFAHRGGPGGEGLPGKGGQDPTYLAEALGISVEELQAAQDAAWQKAIDQAVEKGLLTEEQAQAMKENGAQSGRGHKGAPGGEGMRGWLGDGEDQIDMDALLAAELGISVEALDTARQEASQAAIQAAIESGDLTQEQADLMLAHQAIHSYIDRQALIAQALGMTVEELQAADEAGTRIPDLLEEKGLSEEEFQTAMQAAYEAAVNQAVADGVISQAQAELLLSQEAGMGHGMFPGMRGGRGGHGEFGPCEPTQPQTEDSGTSG